MIWTSMLFGAMVGCAHASETAGPAASLPVPVPSPAASSTAEPDAVVIPDELAGVWVASGREGRMSWRIVLKLQDNRLERTGYPPWQEHATVTRIERDGSTFRLHLTAHQRNRAEVPDGVLELSIDGRRLRMGQNELTRAD